MSDQANANGTTGGMVLTDEIRARRVAVAKDVLERIRLDKLNLAQGVYMKEDEDSWDGKMGLIAKAGGDLQPHVDDLEENCEVCALGAMLLSKARLFDAVPCNILDDRRNDRRSWQVVFHEALEDVFDRETLYRIESAFEEIDFGGCGSSKEDAGRTMAAAVFGAQYGDDVERCEAVMGKIIEGNGEFLIDPIGHHEYMEALYGPDDDYDDLDDEEDDIDMDDDDNDDDLDDEDDD